MATKLFLATTSAAVAAAAGVRRRIANQTRCLNATWQAELDRDIEIVCKIKTICSFCWHVGFNHALNVETSLEDELLFLVISERYG